MAIVSTSAKGQVVIPAALRKKIGLKPGGKVLVALAGENRVTIEPIPDDPIKALRGILKGGPSLTKALLRERRKDRQREAEKFARLVCHPGLDPGRTGRPDGRGPARRSPSKA